MAGSNAFTFTGTEFVPTNRTLTAFLNARVVGGTYSSVSLAYLNTTGTAFSQIWAGYPPTPSVPTYRNVRTGTFPNLNNSIWVDWTCTESTLISSFDVFVKVGSGSFSLAGNVSAATRTYNYGTIPADTTYSFYVRANAVNGLNTTGPQSSTSLASPAAVSNLRETTVTPTAITWTWDVAAGVYQKFDIYRWNGSAWVYNTTTNATEAGTSFTHTWSSLSENTSYSLRVYGQNINAHTSTNTDDTATTSNADPSAPAFSVTATDVASEPGGNTNTTPSVTRYFNISIDPWDDPLFAEVYLDVSTDNSSWTSVTSWTDNTTAKSYNYPVTVTSTTTGETRYFRTRQRDTSNQYSTYAVSGAVVSDVMGATGYTVYSGSGSVSNVYVNGPSLGVTSWAVTSTYLNDTAAYGGDQAFDGNTSKAWRSASGTNERIRIVFPITGNWVNGISAVQFWPAAAYNTYLALSYDGGSTWLGSGSTPGTGLPYVEYVASGSISPNVLNQIDVNPDQYRINGVVGSTSYSWAVRLEFTSTTARTFEVNEINVKQLTQNYTTSTAYRYW